MAGYADDFSMSNNAIDAYDRGLRPRSKWTKADILDALPANARTYLQLDEYPLEFLREYFLEVEEWHHTLGPRPSVRHPKQKSAYLSAAASSIMAYWLMEMGRSADTQSLCQPCASSDVWSEVRTHSPPRHAQQRACLPPVT